MKKRHLMKYKVYHWKDLFNLVQGRDDRCGQRRTGKYLIREWDGTLWRVALVQTHTYLSNRPDEVSIQYHDGTTHRISLEYFCSIVVAVTVNGAWGYDDYFEQSVRVERPYVVPYELTCTPRYVL